MKVVASLYTRWSREGRFLPPLHRNYTLHCFCYRISPLYFQRAEVSGWRETSSQVAAPADEQNWTRSVSSRDSGGVARPFPPVTMWQSNDDKPSCGRRRRRSLCSLRETWCHEAVGPDRGPFQNDMRLIVAFVQRQMKAEWEAKPIA